MCLRFFYILKFIELELTYLMGTYMLNLNEFFDSHSDLFLNKSQYQSMNKMKVIL